MLTITRYKAPFSSFSEVASTYLSMSSHLSKYHADCAPMTATLRSCSRADDDEEEEPPSRPPPSRPPPSRPPPSRPPPPSPSPRTFFDAAVAGSTAASPLLLLLLPLRTLRIGLAVPLLLLVAIDPSDSTLPLPLRTESKSTTDGRGARPAFACSSRISRSCSARALGSKISHAAAACSPNSSHS